jgi:hypothetical protein
MGCAGGDLVALAEFLDGGQEVTRLEDAAVDGAA